MKINFLMYDILRTGGNRIMLEYADLLHKKGYDVIVYKVLKPEKHTKNYTFKSLKEAYLNKFYSVKNNRYNLDKYGSFDFKIKTILTISNLFVRDAEATVVSYWPFSFLLNKLNDSKGKKIYLIQAYENWNCDTDLLHKSFKLPLIKITVSNALRMFIKNICGQESYVILNGLDFNKFYNNKKHFNSGSIVISFIHYEVEFKGSNFALEAVLRLKKDFPELVFNSFGYSKPVNFPEFINFSEKPDDKLIRKIYCDTDIFICTSIEEGFYLVPAEAMACKCAVLSTPVGAVPEYSTDNESVIFIKPKSSVDIFLKTVKLINSSEKIQKLSVNGYEKVRKLLSWEKSVSELESIIKQ